MSTLDGQTPDTIFGTDVVDIGEHKVGEFKIGQLEGGSPVTPQTPDSFGPLWIVEVSKKHQPGYSILGTFKVGERHGGAPLYDKTPILIGGLTGTATDVYDPSLGAFGGASADVLGGISGVTADVLP